MRSAEAGNAWMVTRAVVSIIMGWLMLAGIELSAQGPGSPDPPMAYSEVEKPKTVEEETTSGQRFLEAVSWYLPNRILDMADVPRVYITAGDGMGFSARLMRLLTASWFEDSAYGIGWMPRRPPLFSEHIEERYFCFLAAEAGDLDRDPTEVGLSMHFVALGFNVALSGAEVLDALVGLIGIDLMADDHGPVLMSDQTVSEPVEAATRKQPTPVAERPAASGPSGG